MSGGLMQLVAYGAQDVYLTSNPEMTFFHLVYRRHTNFAMECVENQLNGTVDFGSTSVVTIQRYADLISQIYLRVHIPKVVGNYEGSFAWCRRLGYALIRSVEVQIGGSRIDKQYGTWMDIWYELTHTEDQKRAMNKMLGDEPIYTELSTPDPSTYLIKPAMTLYIPLQFWFCRNVGLAIPLIALQYHEVRLQFEFAPREHLVCFTGSFINSALAQSIKMGTTSLLCNYIFLDSEERRRFAQMAHEYLIDQVQYTGSVSLVTNPTAHELSLSTQLNFNHPTKEIIWAIKNGNYTQGLQFLGYSGTDDWSGVLDQAASTVASSLVTYADASPGTDWIAFTAATGSLELTNYPNLTINYTINDVDESGNPTGTGVTAFTKLFYYKNAPANFFNGLVSKLGDLSIATTGGATVSGLYSVTPISNTLTVRDVSVPYNLMTNTPATPPENLVTVRQHFNFGCLIDGSYNPIRRARIQFNGQDRFSERDGAYFNYVQPYEHHTHTPADGINVYSFAIYPEEYQPSGTANLSRIDTTNLVCTYEDTSRYVLPAPDSATPIGLFSANTELFVYACNYNVLRIFSGLGGLAYSN